MSRNHVHLISLSQSKYEVVDLDSWLDSDRLRGDCLGYVVGTGHSWRFDFEPAGIWQDQKRLPDFGELARLAHSGIALKELVPYGGRQMMNLVGAVAELAGSNGGVI